MVMDMGVTASLAQEALAVFLQPGEQSNSYFSLFCLLMLLMLLPSVCDGVRACTDGSDEEQDFCLDWSCSEGYSKCPDNVQCLPWRIWSPGYPRNAFCYKASWRFNRKQPSPLQCLSGGTNSQETCFQK